MARVFQESGWSTWRTSGPAGSRQSAFLRGRSRIDFVRNTQEGKPVVVPANQVQQALFTATTPLGVELKLVMLYDGRCGILQSGELVELASQDQGSIDRVVKRFLEMAEGG